MKSIDLLFIDGSCHANLSNSFLEDIGFDCFKYILNSDEYDLFVEYIQQPLIDLEKIKERQQIFIDLLNNKSFAENMIEICTSALRIKKAKKHASLYSTIPIKRI